MNVLQNGQTRTGHLNTIQERAIDNISPRRRSSQHVTITLLIDGINRGHNLEGLRITQACGLVDNQVLLLRNFQLTRKDLGLERLILSVCRLHFQGHPGIVRGIFNRVAEIRVDDSGRHHVLLVGIKGPRRQGELGAKATLVHVGSRNEGHGHRTGTTQSGQGVLTVLADIHGNTVLLNILTQKTIAADSDALRTRGVDGRTLLNLHRGAHIAVGMLGAALLNARGGKVTGVVHRNRSLGRTGAGS